MAEVRDYYVVDIRVQRQPRTARRCPSLLVFLEPSI